MKLLVNLSTLGVRPTGLGVYAAHAAAAAVEAFDADLVAPAHYTGPGRVVARSPADISNGTPGRMVPIRRWLWARRVPVGKDTLILSPTHQSMGRGADEVFTIHDLISLRYPEVAPLQSLFFRRLLPRRLEQARAVFTVSETTKLDVQDRFGYPADRIFVVPNGVNSDEFAPGPDVTQREPFFLAVGASLAHKNIEEVMAHAALWPKDFGLRIVGAKGDYRATLEGVVAERSLGARVKFLDYVTQTELVRLYQTCTALVYPSLWEGFGIPPLEALACGASVIASDIAPHREVLGDAAHFVRLGDADSWARAFADVGEGRWVDESARRAVLDRHTWANSARTLKAALLAVEPRLAEKSR